MSMVMAYIIYNELQEVPKKNILIKYLANMTSFYIILMNTVLTVPIFNSLGPVLICLSSNPVTANFQCGSYSWMMHFVVALVTFIVLII